MHFPTLLSFLLSALTTLSVALPAEQAAQTINLEQAAATNHDKSAAQTPLPQLSDSKVSTTDDTSAKGDILKILAKCKNDSCNGGKDDAGKECTAECDGEIKKGTCTQAGGPKSGTICCLEGLLC